jgi:tetratricopeptide (TPR) repeat protein
MFVRPATRQTRKQRSWFIPACIAAVLFIGGVASNLVASDLEEALKPYRIGVWLVCAVAFVAAVIAAIRERSQSDPPEPSTTDSANLTQTGHRNVAANDLNAPVVTGDRNVVATQTQGDVVGGDKVEGDKVARDKIVHHHYATASAANSLRQILSPPRDFTGRKAELDELMRELQPGGATISGLQGMGGVGKTALALKLAESLAARYPDAQFYLDLRGVSPKPVSTAEAMAHVIRAYHPESRLPEDENELRGLYLSALHGQRALLLMDNAANREQVEPLIPPPGCAMLVTSRAHFTLPGLFAKNLNQMTPQEAVELLLKIAPRLGNHSPGLPNLVAEMAKLCGYLPLALRLAASALAERRDLQPEKYLRRLTEATGRLQLVDASLSLSYELLAPESQRLWRSLAVFPVTFDAPAAAAVWQVEEASAEDALGELVKFSLVEWEEDESRYRLHDLARVFADARSSGEERDAAQRRHAEHYKDVLETVCDLYLEGGEAVRRGLSLFDAERANIEAGQAWAASQPEADSQVAQLCIDYPNAGADVLHIRQHPREQIKWLEMALQAARRLKRRDHEGAALGNLGIAYDDLGETRRAIEFYEQHLAIAREIGDRRGEGNVLGNLGSAYAALGETRRAIEFYEQALVIDREIGDRRSEGTALGNLGNAYADLGEMRRAIEFYEQRLAIAREIGDRRGEGNALGNLGSAYADLGETRRAIEFYEQALVIDREIGDRHGEGTALGNLGLAYDDLGETRRAVEFYEQALVIDREIGDRRGEGTALGNLGIAYKNLGETRRAIEFYEQALVIDREIGDRRGEGNALGNLGNAYFNLGETRRAIEFYEQALVIDREIGDRRSEGNDLGNLGVAYADLGETRRAIEFYEQALAIARETGDRSGEGSRLWNLSLALDKLGNREEAIARAEESLRILEEIEAPWAPKVREQLAEWRGQK